MKGKSIMKKYEDMTTDELIDEGFKIIKGFIHNSSKEARTLSGKELEEYNKNFADFYCKGIVPLCLAIAEKYNDGFQNEE